MNKLFCLLLLLGACKGREAASDGYGNFEAEEVIVSAQGTGQIQKFTVEEGQQLDSGQIVGYIDTAQLALKINQLQAVRASIGTKTPNIAAQTAVLKQQRENLLRDKSRIQKMFSEGAATQKQLDDINGALDVIDEQIRAAGVQGISTPSDIRSVTSQIKQLEDQVRKSEIINPVKGTVLEKYANKLETAVYGKPLYKIADLDSMYLRVFLSGGQLAHIKLGQKVDVLVDETKEKTHSLPGRISWISTQAEFTPKTIQTKDERVTQVYAAKVRVKNDGTLKIGMPGEIRLK